VPRVRSPAPTDAPAPAPAPAPAAVPAAKKGTRAKSPARKQSVIEVGTDVLSRHVTHGNKQYTVMVVSIDEDSYVIVWKDNDKTDTLKQRKDLTLLLD
jgi:hypothetical protein